MKLSWTQLLSNPIHGGLAPVISPFDTNSFYIGDGWGSSYPSMRLRELSLISGDELNSVRIGNSIRCLYFDPNKKDILLVSDKKICSIDQDGLSIKENYKKGILKYSSFIECDSSGNVLLMNWLGSYLMVYNLNTEMGRKKKVGKSCVMIHKDNDDEYLLFDGVSGCISKYSIDSNKCQVIFKGNPFGETHIQKQKVYLRHCTYSLDPHGGVEKNPHNTISILDLKDLQVIGEITVKNDFDRFEISNDLKTLLLLNTRKIEALSISNQSTIFTQSFDSDLFLSGIIKEINKLFLHSIHGKREKQLICYDYSDDLK